jgi:predicted PolB exonuclease-like 3'-5' exonuclease
MTNIYLDIETLPDMRPGARDAYLEASRTHFKAPSDLAKEKAIEDLGAMADKDLKFKSKGEVIRLWEEAFAPTLADDVGDQTWRKGAFDASVGQVCCIGWAIGDAEPTTLVLDDPSEERKMLADFFDALTRAFEEDNRRIPTFVGFNHVSFDLPFLYRRAVILGVEPPKFFPINPPAWSEHVEDVMLMWAGVKGRISMDNLCRVLGLEGKEPGIDGSKVLDYFVEGRKAEISHYCRGDVARTRAMYKRLRFDTAPQGVVVENVEEVECPDYADEDEALRQLVDSDDPLRALATGGSAHIRYFPEDRLGDLWKAIENIEAWAAIQRDRIVMALRDKPVTLPDGTTLDLTTDYDTPEWTSFAEERLKSFGMRRDEMYRTSLISPAEAVDFFTNVKPSKVRLERLREVIEYRHAKVVVVTPPAPSTPAPAPIEVAPANPEASDIADWF